MTEPNDKDRALVSVVVPVYNIADYVERCVQSIISQTYTNLEILLIDDGSTDGSEMICDELSCRDNRIKVIHQQNQGIATTRNIGVEKSKGDYIAFIDGDDFIDKDMIELLYSEIRKSNADIAYCNYRVISPQSSEIREEGNSSILTFTGRDALLNLLLHKPYFDMFIWDGLYSKNVIVPFIKGILYEDQVFSVESMLKSEKIIVCTAKKYNYVFRPSGLTHSSAIGRKIRDCGLATDYMKEAIIKTNDSQIISAFYNRCLRNYVNLLSLSTSASPEDFAIVRENIDTYSLLVFSKSLKYYILHLILKIKYQFLYKIVFRFSDFLMGLRK